MTAYGKNPGEGIAVGLLVMLVLIGFFLPFFFSPSQGAFYDNTSIEARLNVTNSLPRVTGIIIHDNDTLGGNPTIILNQGTRDTVYCNATITDFNGYDDITKFNATFFHSTSSQFAGDDMNDHYTNTSTSCINETIPGNLTSIKVQCSFPVMFFANNGSWSCNITATDSDGGFNHSYATKSIDPLYALDLNTTVIDYGELSPTESSANDVPVIITNFGNMDINISVEGYGIGLHDNLSMDCDSGNISVYYERYATQPGLAITSMTNLTTLPLLNGITGLTVAQNIDDAGNSTNTTYWKMEVPVGLKGFCNGTVLFSGIGPV